MTAMNKPTSVAMQSDSPVFIVGAPRSGTTMLQFRLRKLPGLSLPTGESHFFVPLYQNRDKFGDLSRIENIRAVLQTMYKQSREFLETDLHGMQFDLETLAAELHASGCHTLPAIISGLFEKNAQGEGKTRWGDKTPYYVMHMTKLLEWFPKAQFVHLIRDGRDVALSLFGRRNDFYVYNAYFAAEYWESYIQKGREQGRRLPPNQYLELRYEDLLAAPENTMRSLCEFLGENYSEEMFEVSPVDDPDKTPLVHEPLKADNAGKWRTRMTAAQIHAFESVAGNTLRELGYELATAAQPPWLVTKAAYRLHNKLLTAYWQRAKSKPE